MDITSSMVSAASTARGGVDRVGIGVLDEAMNIDMALNAQLLSSIPQAPRPGGSYVDLYA